jgi:protein TonB
MKIATFSAYLIGTVLAFGGVSAAIPPVPVPVSYKVSHSGAFISFADANVAPKPIHIEKPIYPAEFRSAQIAGYALTDFIIDTSGTPTQVQIVRASDQAFAVAALAAMELWRFSVGEKNGKPVACRVEIPIEFKP